MFCGCGLKLDFLRNQYNCDSICFRDVAVNPDCLDQTDESSALVWQEYYRDPVFRCEERKCRPAQGRRPCGDGECRNEMSRCYNGLLDPLFDDPCSIVVACYMNYIYLIDVGMYWKYYLYKK
jgi:hypothetical protein